MYAKHCNIVLQSGGDEVISLKLHHLPIEGMSIKFKPLSTGIETEYRVEEVSLVMEEVTTTYPGQPDAFSNGWEHEWLVEVSEVV